MKHSLILVSYVHQFIIDVHKLCLSLPYYHAQNQTTITELGKTLNNFNFGTICNVWRTSVIQWTPRLLSIVNCWKNKTLWKNKCLFKYILKTIQSIHFCEKLICLLALKSYHGPKYTLLMIRICQFWGLNLVQDSEDQSIWWLVYVLYL